MHILGHRIIPNGPNLKCPLHFDFNLSGTKLSFDVPENNGTWDNQNGIEEERNYNLYAMDLSRWNEADLYEPKEYIILIKKWEFWGLPFIHRAAFADMELRVVLSHLPDFSSLFRPRRLECAIERLIYTGRNRNSVDPKMIRKDWSLKSTSGNIWVNYFYEREGLEGTERKTLGEFWQIAITDEHLLTLRFEVNVIKKPLIVKEYAKEIIDLVLNSLKLELSQDAKAERDRAKRENPHESLSASMPPYDFEQMIWYEHYDMIGKVSSEVENSHSMQNDKFDKLVADAEADQERRYQEMRARIMATHMRFNELEAEDLKRFRSGQDSKS